MRKEKRVKKTLEELNVIDDFLFTELLLHPESADLLVRLIIECATGLKVGELIIEPQCVYNGVNTDRHGIRMDARVQNPEISMSESTDSTLRVFDIEPNVKEDKELPKRVRYSWEPLRRSDSAISPTDWLQISGIKRRKAIGKRV